MWLIITANGGHAEWLPEWPVLHQQRDPDSAATVCQHERPSEEQAGCTQPPQSAGRRTGGAWSHDLVNVTGKMSWTVLQGGKCVHLLVVHLCSTILDSPVTEQEFLEQLHELNSKINFAKELSFRETLACSDIQDIVDRLKLKVTDILQIETDGLWNGANHLSEASDLSLFTVVVKLFPCVFIQSPQICCKRKCQYSDSPALVTVSSLLGMMLLTLRICGCSDLLHGSSPAHQWTDMMMPPPCFLVDGAEQVLGWGSSFPPNRAL